MCNVGLRDVEDSYEKWFFDELPDYFKYNEEYTEKFNKLREGVRLMNKDGVLDAGNTDISCIMSSYLAAKNGTRYHLHPELVDESTETVDVCTSCMRLIHAEGLRDVARLEKMTMSTREDEEDVDEDEEDDPELLKLRSGSLSIAAGFDYGVLSRVAGLTPLSTLENALLTPNRA